MLAPLVRTILIITVGKTDGATIVTMHVLVYFLLAFLLAVKTNSDGNMAAECFLSWFLLFPLQLFHYIAPFCKWYYKLSKMQRERTTLCFILHVEERVNQRCFYSVPLRRKQTKYRLHISKSVKSTVIYRFTIWFFKAEYILLDSRCLRWKIRVGIPEQDTFGTRTWFFFNFIFLFYFRVWYREQVGLLFLVIIYFFL